MADFRFKVGADYSEFLASSRGVISGLRGELRSLQQQAQVQVREQGNVRGVGSELAAFQGRGQAALDEAMRRGVINQTQYNEESARLKNAVAELRSSINRQAQSQGLNPRSRIGEIDPAKVTAAQSGQAAVFEERRVTAAREAAAASQLEANQIRANVAAEAALRAEARAALQARLRAELAASGETITQARQRRYQDVYGVQAPDVAARARADEEAAAARTAADSRRTAYEDRTGAPAAGARRVAQEQARQAAIEARNTGLIEEKAVKLRQSLESQQAEIAAQRQNVQLMAQVNNERRRMISELRREEISQRGGGAGQPGGSVFQRLQSFVASRRTGEDRLPEEFQSFGQFFTSKALTTGGFALSGAVLYGTVQAFRQTIREASALQRELQIVKAQFDDVGAAADGMSGQPGFKEFARQVVEVSIDTGVAADQVTRVSRQLAGVFKTDTGLPDFNKALGQTHEALKLSQVTGLPYQEITDSLTAITATFGTSFTTIGDLAIGLEQKFGVLAPEIIKFVADLAPVAKELGFTVDQVAALGAIAQQRSGVSGGALAESFNRALPTIQGNQVGIAEILGQRESTAAFIQPVLDALAKGKGATVIAQLTDAYANMTKGQRNALAEMLGGQRNAKAFFAVLQGGKDTIDALNNSNPDQFAGKLDQRFKDFQSTVEFAFQRAGRALEEFGLALFNSGIADGLKLIADNGALVAQFVSQLVSLFTSFNDAMGGIPVKLLSIYATLKLISALRGSVNLSGITGALRGGIAGGTGQVGGGAYGITLPGEEGLLVGGAALTARQAGSPVLRRLLGAQRANLEREIAGGATQELVATAGTVRTGIAGLVESLAPLIAITAVASLISTIGKVNSQIGESQKALADKVREEISKGTSPDEILRRAQQAGGFDNATGSTAGDVALKVLSFGTADTTSPGDRALDAIQKSNATRQIEELTAISKGMSEQDRKRAEKFIELFKNDPANNALNDAVAKIIAESKRTATPEVRAALQAISQQYAATTAGAAAQTAADDFAATVEQVKANYDAGNASLSELIAAEDHEVALLRDALERISDPKAKADAAKKLAAQLKERDQVITTAAQRTADLGIQFAGIRGGNVVAATATGRLQQALTIIEQGATPDTQLDATLNALTAQQQLLNQAVNAPVIVDGIARAPTTAEKLARLAAGIQIPPTLRSAIIKAQLSSSAMKTALAATVAKSSTNTGLDDVINQVTAAIVNLGPQEIQALKGAIDKKIKEIEDVLKTVGVLSDSGRAGLEQTLADLKAARAQLDNVDPGGTLSGDQTDLQNQQAIDQANENKAYAEALIAQQRARAHGDPVGVALAGIRSAQLALQYARASGKPSEVAAAQAQLIEAQNQLQDANAGIIQARFAVAIAAAAGDPVQQARLQLDQLREAARHVHGEAERLQNEAAQIAADRALHDAIRAVFYAQLSLAEAVATAAGDSVKAAQIGAQQAKEKLQDLLAQGADPNGSAAIAAQQAVVESTARVRDAQLATQQRDIDFALQMEQITTQQAIAQLQALLQIPNLTAEQTQQLLLKIRQLQNDVSRNLQFDIPNEIKLPTLYEVRRLQQVGTPGGPSSYNDNRNIQITLTAGSQVDLQPAVDIIVGAITAPPRNGSEPGAYSN